MEPANNQSTNTPPAELPKTLPAGTRWQGSAASDRGVATTELKIAVADNGYSCLGITDGEKVEHRRWIPPSWIVWSSVPAPAPAPAPVKDECWACGGEACDNPIGIEKHPSATGQLFPGCRLCATCWARIPIKNQEAIRARRAPKSPASKSPSCDCCGAPTVKHCSLCAKCEDETRPPAIDPYLAHNAALATNSDFAAWSREQGKKRGAERRFGIMGNRDKYGQLLGATWDSDDVESV